MNKQGFIDEKQVLQSLPLINFILSLLIVFHHSFTSNVDYTGSYSIGAYGWQIAVERFMYNFSECAVPIFFFLSAYLFYRSFDGSWSQYKAKISRRIFSLFVPYVLFCTLGYIKHLAVSHVGGVFWIIYTHYGSATQCRFGLYGNLWHCHLLLQ